MRTKNVGILSVLGMLVTGFSVYAVTPDASAIAADRDDDRTGSAGDDSYEEADASPESTFLTGGTVTVEGRIGHDKLGPDARGETYVMVEVGGEAQGSTQAQPAPVNLALVIDRSGSMKGARMQNAQTAAIAAVERLNDGDVVSIVTFDTRTSVIVPPTTVSASSRADIAQRVRGIQLGGDTCVSCGVEDALLELNRTMGKVNQMVVLSDGDANHGIRELEGFHALARRAREQGVSVTTIGVDVLYNEKILSALAQSSEGRHYFVENASSLSRVFASEAEALTRTIASDTQAVIELADGVELTQVFDRQFTRSGNRITIPMGTVQRGEKKTILVKVRVNHDDVGLADIADVSVSYQDLTQGARQTESGHLALAVTDDRDDRELDPIVAGRIQRSQTATALRQANDLFVSGKIAEAQKTIDVQRGRLAAASKKAKAKAPAKSQPFLAKDFDRQESALDSASSGFATPPPPVASPFGGGQVAGPPRPAADGEATIRRNAQVSRELSF